MVQAQFYINNPLGFIFIAQFLWVVRSLNHDKNCGEIGTFTKFMFMFFRTLCLFVFLPLLAHGQDRPDPSEKTMSLMIIDSDDKNYTLTYGTEKSTAEINHAFREWMDAQRLITNHSIIFTGDNKVRLEGELRFTAGIKNSDIHYLGDVVLSFRIEENQFKIELQLQGKVWPVKQPKQKIVWEEFIQRKSLKHESKYKSEKELNIAIREVFENATKYLTQSKPHQH